MKFLVVGLGNIGDEYANTRHNVGFNIVDECARSSNASFCDARYGAIAKIRIKNQEIILLKPSTYMNLSGNAVRYWMNKENIDLNRVIIIVDDLSLPLGSIRIKEGGSEGGHNGLKSISQCLSTQKYARLRFGIGNDFPKGSQVDYVLGKFSEEDTEFLKERYLKSIEAIKAYVLSGIQFAMNHYNNK